MLLFTAKRVLSGILLLVAVVLLFTTRHGRGLPGLLSGQDLTDARETAAAPAPPSAR